MPWLYVVDTDRYEADLREVDRRLGALGTASPAGGHSLHTHSGVSPTLFAHRMMTFFEDLFGRDWLANGPESHLGVQQWRACNALWQRRSRVVYPNDVPLLLTAVQSLLNAGVLMSLTGSDFGALRLGNLKGYGDMSVQTKVESRLHDSRQWADVLVELYTAGYYAGQAAAVTPLPEGDPGDIRVDCQSGLPTFIECKSLWSGSENALRASIKKAGRQLKRVETDASVPSYASCIVLDVSNVVGLLNNTDEVPSEVRRLAEVVQRVLSGDKNRSINLAVLVWDAYSVVERERAAGVFAVRKALPDRHAGETRAQEPPVEVFQGYTAFFLIQRRDDA